MRLLDLWNLQKQANFVFELGNKKAIYVLNLTFAVKKVMKSSEGTWEGRWHKILSVKGHDIKCSHEKQDAKKCFMKLPKIACSITPQNVGIRVPSENRWGLQCLPHRQKAEPTNSSSIES
jgi:hypothetical protein